MEYNLITLLSVITVILIMSYYGLTSRNRNLSLAYGIAVANGALGTWLNTLLGVQPGQKALLLYNISSCWIIIMGIKGLFRLRQEKKQKEIEKNVRSSGHSYRRYTS